MKRFIPSQLRRHLIVLLFFTALSLIMTWPLITKIGVAYAGNNEDLWTFQWDNWWTRYALQHGYDILFTPMQFYPIGVSLAAHSLSFYNSLLWIPLAAISGDIAAYNITILLTFILSGYAMFLLAEYLLVNWGSGIRDQGSVAPSPKPRSPIPALIAGIVYAFAPYHFSQSLGHVSLASVQWFPLLALFVLKAAREPREQLAGLWPPWRHAIAIGLVTLLITATRLQFLVLGGVVFAVFVVVDWIISRREWVRGAFSRLIVGALLGMMLSLPIVLPAANLYAEAASPDTLIADEQTWGQTDLLAYVLPMTYHPLLGPLVQPLYENFIKNQAWMPFLGYTTIGLSIWGVVRLKRRSLVWVVIGLFLFVMALGPFLRINGVAYANIKLPYALIGDKFPLNTLRSPDRYNLLLMLALAPLVAFGVDDLLKRTRHADVDRRSLPTKVGAPTIMGIVIGGLILFEYLGVPYPTIRPLPTSPFEQHMANDRESYAILDIPLDRSNTKRYLYYQTLHEHPIVQGRVARVPEAAFQLFDEIPLLAAWYRSIGAPRVPDLGAQLQQLAANNVRYIIFHKDLSPAAFVTTLRNYFTLPPLYEDDQIAVYSTRPPSPASTAIGGGLGMITSWVGVEGPDKPIRVRIRWTATGPIGREYAYRLRLRDEAGTDVVESTEPITPSTSTWPSGTLVVGDYQLTPTTPIPIGHYAIRLEVLDGNRVIGAIDLPHRLINEPVLDDGQWLMVVSDEPRVRFDAIPIELRAADVSRRGNMLNLWLHWKAIDAPGVDTKYFVHLLDANGNVAVQDDGIHVKYTRPSSQWRAGEIISDLIELPLWNLPPGEYRLAVGLTNPDTGERWPAFDEHGQLLPDRRYIFSRMIKIG
jgi:hypothetical protein